MLSKMQFEVRAKIHGDPNAAHDQIAASIGKGGTPVVKAIRQPRKGGCIERVDSNKLGWRRVLRPSRFRKGMSRYEAESLEDFQLQQDRGRRH